jgi:transposase
MPREKADSVRIVRLEIASVDGDWKEVTKRWHTLQDEMKEISNLMWQTWLVWHAQNHSSDKLREWLNQRAENGVKAAGKCPVKPMPNELSKIIYDAVRGNYASVSTRSHVLMQNKINQGIGSRKAAKGSLPGWSAILLCHESMPSFTKPVPIPFDKRNAKLIETEDGCYIEFRLTLIEKGKSRIETAKLWTGGKSVRSQVDVFRKIIAGEFEYCGSSLTFDRGRKKWFAMVAYKRPVHRIPNLDPAKTAYLVPGRDVPFKLYLPGKKRPVWLQHRGHHITAIRQRIFSERRDRSANYRNATTRKGKGREHSQTWRDVWSRKWQKFVKRVNHAVSADVVRHCRENGVGNVVYCKPGGVVVDHRCITHLGATGRDQSSWEFFQLKTMLEYKCQDAGIQLKTVEFDGSKSVKSKAVKAVASDAV